MTWSYDPVKTPKDEVRLLIGDTNSKDPILQDEEIKYLLTRYNNYPLNAALQACELIIAKFSRLADETVGSVSKSWSQKGAAYFKMMEQMRTRIGVSGARPYAGGISKSDKDTNNSNNDRVKPVFSKHQFENEQVAPWVSQNQVDDYTEDPN